MTRAYSDLYLDSAPDILGHALDWVANTCGEDITEFCNRFCQSRISKMFETGYPKYIAGCNGAELANFVMEDLNLPEYSGPYEFYADASPEYWTGWMLAYFQWKKNLTFAEILQKIPITKILMLYPTGHEQDVRKVADILDEFMVDNSDTDISKKV